MTEQTILPEEAPVLQHGHQDATDVLALCGGQCHLLCCCVFGRRHRERWCKQLNKLVRKASSERTERTERKMKVKVIMVNPSHPLYTELRKLRSTCSYRLIQPQSAKCLGGGLQNSKAPTHPSTTQHLPTPPTP